VIENTEEVQELKASLLLWELARLRFKPGFACGSTISFSFHGLGIEETLARHFEIQCKCL
jgi:hypothetical protein